MMAHDVFVKLLTVLVLFDAPFCKPSQNITLLNRWRRQTCRENDFKCGSGECIPKSLVCDGERNCKDRSDETSDTCFNLVIPNLASYLDPPLTSYIDKCPSNQFRCDNGNCISISDKCNNRNDCSDGSDEKGCGSSCRSNEFKCKSGLCIAPHLVCNGMEDCADGSDEISTLCRLPTTPPPKASGCQFPSQPQNGKYHLGGCEQSSCQISPGTISSNFATLKYTCNEGFKLTGEQIVWCFDEVWTSSFPTCEKQFCKPLNDPSRHFDCIFSGAKVNCSESMASGTVAKIRCESFFHTIPELSNYDIICKENGEWTSIVHSCTPECGIRNPDGLPFIGNGNISKFAEFPWHVGIYKKVGDEFIHTCGGNIITSKVIVTAAHCFWDENGGRRFDINDYIIAAGKYYREWNQRTRYFQKSEIEKVEMAGGFKGDKALYAGDIAVVILKRRFQINEAVRPICLDLEGKFSEDFTPGKTGIVVGWGYTEHQVQSEKLHSIELLYIDRSKCLEISRESYKPYITVYDKFCVGNNKNKSVCPGDSGGGFATKFGTRYYLMGIVSSGVRPQGNDNCEITQYSTFTKVLQYYEFIRKFYRTV